MTTIEQAGVTVLLDLLFGEGSSVDPVNTQCIGKFIKSVVIHPDGNDGDGELVFEFVDGTKAVVLDEGRSCCEMRYLHTDDDLSCFTGAVFAGMELRDVPNIEDDLYSEVHEVQFLIVNTSLGSFTVETHNEHNGYYGGFVIQCRIEEMS